MICELNYSETDLLFKYWLDKEKKSAILMKNYVLEIARLNELPHDDEKKSKLLKIQQQLSMETKNQAEYNKRAILFERALQ